jgi:hypothetical protein
MTFVARAATSLSLSLCLSSTQAIHRLVRHRQTVYTVLYGRVLSSSRPPPSPPRPPSFLDFVGSTHETHTRTRPLSSAPLVAR